MKQKIISITAEIKKETARKSEWGDWKGKMILRDVFFKKNKMI